MENSVLPAIVNSKAMTIIIATVCIIVVVAFLDYKFKKSKAISNE